MENTWLHYAGLIDNIVGIMNKFIFQQWHRSCMRCLPLILAYACLVNTPRIEAAHLLDLGARYHAEHHRFDKLPFGNNDISYLLAYSYAESRALWQLGVDFAPDLSGKMVCAGGRVVEDLDYAVTPHLNLIVKDNYFRGGVGVRATYVETGAGSEWLDPYWQFLLGVNLPLAGRFSLDASANYVFQRWEYLDGFDFRDLEYQLTLNMQF